jgi:hypothetical protein
VKQAKVEDENGPDHSHPTGCQREIRQEHADGSEKQGKAQACFCEGKNPFSSSRLVRNLILVEKFRCRHSWPGQQVAHSPGQGSDQAVPSSIAIGQPFAARIEGKGHGPHENPWRDLGAQSQGRRRQNQKRQQVE